MTRVLAAVRGAGVLLALAVLGAAARADSVGPAALSGADREFLARHWRRPIPPQGPAPGAFSALERSLLPGSCGTCHPAQLADWTTTLHARSMGPSVLGQLIEMTGAAQIREALEATRRSPFVIFTQDVPLT
jgi:hypothetical protein